MTIKVEGESFLLPNNSRAKRVKLKSIWGRAILGWYGERKREKERKSVTGLGRVIVLLGNAYHGWITGASHSSFVLSFLWVDCVIIASGSFQRHLSLTQGCLNKNTELSIRDKCSIPGCRDTSEITVSSGWTPTRWGTRFDWIARCHINSFFQVVK